MPERVGYDDRRAERVADEDRTLHAEAPLEAAQKLDPATASSPSGACAAFPDGSRRG
jgi:hypothetical protein